MRIRLTGVIDLSEMNVETPETIAARIRRALPYVAAEDIIVAPDCGMKYLPRDVAFGKMKAMVAGAAIMRKEHGIERYRNCPEAHGRASLFGPKKGPRRRGPAFVSPGTLRSIVHPAHAAAAPRHRLADSFFFGLRRPSPRW